MFHCCFVAFAEDETFCYYEGASIRDEKEGVGTKHTFLQFFLHISSIDHLAILQKSLDRALFLYNFVHEVRSIGVRASITIVDIRKFYRKQQSIIRF